MIFSRKILIPMIAACLALAACTSKSTGAKPTDSAGMDQATGPGDGGGGNISSTSKTQVLAMTSRLKDRLRVTFHRFEWDVLRKTTSGVYIYTTDAQKAENDPVLQSLILDGQIQQFIDRLRIKPVDGDCLDPLNNEGRDGSMNSQGEMCLSVSRISRIPEESLPLELLALAAHELAHFRGANEAEAQEVQQAVHMSNLTQTDANDKDLLGVLHQLDLMAFEASFMMNSSAEFQSQATPKPDLVRAFCGSVGTLEDDLLSLQTTLNTAPAPQNVTQAFGDMNESFPDLPGTQAFVRFRDDVVFECDKLVKDPRQSAPYAQMTAVLENLALQMNAAANEIVNFDSLDRRWDFLSNLDQVSTEILLGVQTGNHIMGVPLPSESFACELKSEDGTIQNLRFQPAPSSKSVGSNGGPVMQASVSLRAEDGASRQVTFQVAPAGDESLFLTIFLETVDGSFAPRLLQGLDARETGILRNNNTPPTSVGISGIFAGQAQSKLALDFSISAAAAAGEVLKPKSRDHLDCERK